MSDSPNYRLYVRHEEDSEPVRTTLREVLADNEGAMSVCDAVRSLQPGEEVRVNGVWLYSRPVVSPPRYTRVRVPIDMKTFSEFRNVPVATMEIDRKRLTVRIRPLRRRTVVELSLQELAEHYLAKQVRLNAAAKLKARRARR